MTDYATLQSDIANWSARDSLTANIPSFIRIAEASIARKVRVAQMIQSTTLVVDDTGSVVLPARFLGARAVATLISNGLTQSPRIDYVSPDQFAELEIDASLIRGIDADSFYTLSGNELKVSPKPGTGDTVDLFFEYWQRFEALETVATNWLIQNHYDVYLYTSLAELYNYRQAPEDEIRYRGLVDKIVDELHTSERRKLRTGPHIRRPEFAP